MAKGVQIYLTYIFLKWLSSELLGLENAIFFEIEVGVKLASTLRTQILKTVGVRELGFLSFYT